MFWSQHHFHMSLLWAMSGRCLAQLRLLFNLWTVCCFSVLVSAQEFLLSLQDSKSPLPFFSNCFSCHSPIPEMPIPITLSPSVTKKISVFALKRFHLPRADLLGLDLWILPPGF